MAASPDLNTAEARPRSLKSAEGAGGGSSRPPGLWGHLDRPDKRRLPLPEAAAPGNRWKKGQASRALWPGLASVRLSPRAGPGPPAPAREAGGAAAARPAWVGSARPSRVPVLLLSHRYFDEPMELRSSSLSSWDDGPDAYWKKSTRDTDAAPRATGPPDRCEGPAVCPSPLGAVPRLVNECDPQGRSRHPGCSLLTFPRRCCKWNYSVTGPLRL